MTVQEMRQRKRELGYTYAQLSELSGVPLGTVQKIFSGETENPRYDTVMALTAALQPGQGIAEEALEYYAHPKRQGMYTLEDYYDLPEDQRMELIDGCFFEMLAPTTFHQRIAGEVYRQIANYIYEKGGECSPFISPVDVQLDRDDRTMVEPDVVIVCHPDQIINRCIMGAPDFVLEVISPGTKRKDYLLKLRKYEAAGVREYWLVDPYQKTVLVYFFEDDKLCPCIYPLDSEIPLNLFEGKLILDLHRIAAWVAHI